MTAAYIYSHDHAYNFLVSYFLPELSETEFRHDAAAGCHIRKCPDDIACVVVGIAGPGVAKILAVVALVVLKACDVAVIDHTVWILVRTFKRRSTYRIFYCKELSIIIYCCIFQYSFITI